ncbi:MAG: hypothetical protein OXH39_21730 [Candidatus Poribacteria bacterium]|nr:hypothetical protein [Candidatus Poribacteria bacterium]
MENQNIDEMYLNERIESIGTQVQEPNEAVSEVEWRLNNQIRVVKEDLKQDIKDVKEDLKEDIREVKTDLENDINGVKRDLKSDISDLKGFITILVTIAGFIISGVITVVVKFL